LGSNGSGVYAPSQLTPASSTNAAQFSSGGFGSSDPFSEQPGAASTASSLLSPLAPPRPASASPQIQAAQSAAIQRGTELSSRIEDVKSLAQQQSKINEEYQKQLDAQLAINTQLEADLAREEARLNQLAEESRTLASEHEAKKAEGQAIRIQIKTATERTAAHVAKLQELQMKKQALMSELAAGEQELEKIKSEAKHKKKAVRKEEHSLQEIQSLVASLKQKIAEAQNKRTAVEERMAAAVETNLKLKQEVDALATKLATLEANVAAKQKAMEDEATQKRALKEQARRLEEEKEQARAALSRLEIQQKQQQEEMRQAMNSSSSLNDTRHLDGNAQTGFPSGGIHQETFEPNFFDSAQSPALKKEGNDFFDIATSGSIDPVETRDFFGGTASSATGGDFPFDPFAHLEAAPTTTESATNFFPTDDAFA